MRNTEININSGNKELPDFNTIYKYGVIPHIIKEGDPMLPLRGYEFAIFEIDDFYFRPIITDLDEDYYCTDGFETSAGIIRDNKMLDIAFKFGIYKNFGVLFPELNKFKGRKEVLFQQRINRASYRTNNPIEEDKKTFSMYQNTKNSLPELASEIIYDNDYFTITANPYYRYGYYNYFDIEEGIGMKSGTVWSSDRYYLTIVKEYKHEIKYKVMPCNELKVSLEKLIDKLNNQSSFNDMVIFQEV